MVVLALNPSWGGRGRRITELKSAWSSEQIPRTDKTTQKNPISRKQIEKKWGWGSYDDRIYCIKWEVTNDQLR